MLQRTRKRVDVMQRPLFCNDEKDEGTLQLYLYATQMC